MKLFFVVTALVISICAHAFIPRSSMILSRTAENSGSGSYQIEQEVTFNSNDQQLTVHESWLIQSPTQMHLTVTGTKEHKDQVLFLINYRNGNKSEVSITGAETSEKIGSSFFEPIFHSRNSKNLAEFLIKQNIAPSDILERKPYTGKFVYSPEPYVRLSRTGGVTTYAYGTPTPADPSYAKTENPGLWIEQDQFLIRKIRFADQTEVIADGYGEYSRGLALPKVRTIRIGSNQVSVKLISVSGKPSKDAKQASRITGYRSEISQNPVFKDQFEEFYKRCR